MTASKVIEVPLASTNDVLEIDCDNLPEDVEVICDILNKEVPTLRFHHIFALEYYKQGFVDKAIITLKRGIGKSNQPNSSDKMQLLLLLANVYVQKAKTIHAAAERELFLQMAGTLLNEAERTCPGDGDTALVRGMLALARRQPEAALREFAQAKGVAALMGTARTLFGRKQYAQALGAYQQALALRPRGRPDPRIGIGLCLEKLGHAAAARRAFERAAAVDAAAAAPLVLLGTMDLNAAKLAAQHQRGAEAAALVRSGMARFEAAWRLQPANAAVLLRLADRLCWRGGWERARAVAERALAAADTMAMEAEAHYAVGRALHGAARFDAAHDAYARALAINARHVLARYGLAQTLLQRADMSGAEAALARVLDAQPRCTEALRALGYLHARLPNTKAKALEYYERAMAELNDAPRLDAAGDADLFLEAALLYEATAARKAARAYGVAAALLGARAVPELWNNIGALAHTTGGGGAARDAYQRAADLLRGDASARARQTRATLAYNVALLYERAGRWRRAEAHYGALLQLAPGYADARLRLAHIALVFRAQPDAALAHIARVLAHDPRRAAALLLRGTVELARSRVQDARRAFEAVLKDVAKHDTYALCALGNFHLAAGRAEAARAAELPDARARVREQAAASYRRALEFFDKSLQIDGRC
ncbi:protein required for normal CLN1 and CLN2 G1 cyclin expression, partial [Kickxella alabastrina]